MSIELLAKNKFELLTKNKAAEHIAQIGKGGRPLKIFLGEDLCFGVNRWVNVGKITLHPESIVQVDADLEPYYDEICAVLLGGFEWHLPTEETLNENIVKALNLAETNDSRRIEQNVIKYFHQGLQDVVRRTLLQLPIFDASSVSRMPLQKPITIVPDTSAVHQGALNFVCHFLTPAARIKVPAIVHMEIVEHSDNYFKGIRWDSDAWKDKKIRSSLTPDAALKDTARPRALDRHLLSQGGQRTLLRIELNPDVEIERGDLGSDPLRGIITSSSDPEDKNLRSTQVVKSFADRLILETARRVQTQVRPNHPLAILTSDQGMARMAIAEGMEVLFFQARYAPTISGTKLTGALFHPFKQDLVLIPLTEVLWELAVSFGCLRLEHGESGAFLELWGIGGGEEIPPSIDEIRDDLLRGRYEPGTELPRKVVITDTTATSETKDSETQVVTLSEQPLDQRPVFYPFSPNNMFKLIHALVEKGAISNSEAQHIVGVQTEDKYRRYESFLRSGRFVIVEDDFLKPTKGLSDLWEALLHEDQGSLLECLNRTPSFKTLYGYVISKKRVSEDDSGLPVPESSKANYLSLGEAACAWLVIPKEGIVATDKQPDIEIFCLQAKQAYETLRSRGETEWILTGAWLEAMAFLYAIHPIAVRNILKEAQNQNVLRAYAEGSTPDTRNKHRMWMLDTSDVIPQLIRVSLYHGDFLLPGTAAVRIKIEGVDDAS